MVRESDFIVRKYVFYSKFPFLLENSVDSLKIRFSLHKCYFYFGNLIFSSKVRFLVRKSDFWFENPIFNSEIRFLIRNSDYYWKIGSWSEKVIVGSKIRFLIQTSDFWFKNPIFYSELLFLLKNRFLIRKSDFYSRIRFWFKPRPFFVPCLDLYASRSLKKLNKVQNDKLYSSSFRLVFVIRLGQRIRVGLVISVFVGAQCDIMQQTWRRHPEIKPITFFRAPLSLPLIEPEALAKK